MRLVTLALTCFALLSCDVASEATPLDAGTHTDANTTCGDGSRQEGEECDDGGDTWECDTQCHRRTIYVACKTPSDCGTERDCVDGVCTERCQQQSDGWFRCPSEDVPEGVKGVTCYLDEKKPDEGWCRAACRSERDCPGSLSCIDFVCGKASNDVSE